MHENILTIKAPSPKDQHTTYLCLLLENVQVAYCNIYRLHKLLDSQVGYMTLRYENALLQSKTKYITLT